MSTNVWLITGCSSGLGRDIALAAAARGDRVVATARRLESIRALASERIKLLQLDVCAVSPSFVQDAVALFGEHPNVHVANAGYGLIGALEETTDAEIRALFDTNVFGLLNVLRALLPGIRGHGERGWILPMSSMGGHTASPMFGSYHATKHALTAINTALAGELKPFGTHVCAIEPGVVKTGFFGASSTRSSGYALATGRPDGDPYKETREAREAHFAKVGGTEPTDSRKCAERIVDLVRGEGIFKNRAVPLQLVLGQEAIDRIKPVLEAKMESMAEYADVSQTVRVD